MARTPRTQPARPEGRAHVVAVEPRCAVGKGLLLAHLALSPLLFSTATLGAFEFPKAALLHLTAIGCVALGLHVWLRRRAPRPAEDGDTAQLTWRQRPLALGMLLFLISAVVSTLTSLSIPTSLLGTHESHAGLLTIAAYVALFFATRAFCQGCHDARMLLSACVFGAAGASVYALIQFCGWDPIVWADVSGLRDYARPFGTLGHANFLSAYLVMALPLVLHFAARAAAQKRRAAAAVLGLVAVLSCLAVVLSVSRGAWLALGCVLLALLGGAWLSGRRRVAVVGLGWAGAAAVALAALLVLGRGHAAVDAVHERLSHLGDSSGRQHIWDVAASVFAEHPLTGCGPDAFQIAFGPHRPAAYWQVEWGVTPARAHNVLLHALATQGLPGALALLAVLVGVAVAGVRAWRRAPDEFRPLLFACGAGVLGFVVQGAFSYTVAACGALFVTFAAVLSRCGDCAVSEQPAGRRWYVVGLAFAVLGIAVALGQNFAGSVGGYVTLAAILCAVGAAGWAVMGAAAAAAGAEAGASSGKENITESNWANCGRLVGRGVVWACAAAAVAFGVVRPTVASVTGRSGERLFVSNPQRAVDLLGRAAVMDPWREDHWTRFAGIAQAGARRVKYVDQRRALNTLARTALLNAIALSPNNAHHHDNLGQLLGRVARDNRDVKAAYEAFDRALALDPRNVQFLADAANAALGVGDFAAAEVYARRGVAMCPRYGVTRAQVGYLTLVQKRYEEAARLFYEAIHGEWRDAGQHERVLALANLATALMNMDRYKDAADVSRQALELAPQLTALRCRLGGALEKLGKREEAFATYRQVLKEVPQHPEAVAGLARLIQAMPAEESGL